MTNSPRVLYVDDNSNSLEVRAIMLGEYGIDVVTETNVEDARGRLAEGDIDCVLSDLDMPDEDGFDLLEYVEETHPEIPFIMFTSHESEDVIGRALDSGAIDYFPKSLTNVSYRLLAHRIEQAVRIVEAEQAVAAGADTRVGETETEAEIGVPRTEVDPSTKRQQADVDGWGWEMHGPTETTAADPVSAATAENTQNGPRRIAADGPAETAEPTADTDWKVTRETNDALQWLNSDETGAELDAIEPRTDENGTEPEPDPFIYPGEKTSVDAEPKAGDETEVTAETRDEGIDIVGTVQMEPESEDPEITAETKASTATADTEEPTSTVTEPTKISPIPGAAPPGVSTEAPESTKAPSENGEIDEAPVASAESGGTDGEEQLAAKINLGSDTAEEASQAPEEPERSTERQKKTPADAESLPSVSLGPEDREDPTLEAEPESEGEDGPEPEPDPSAHEHDHTLLEEFDPEPGEGVLVECGSQDSRKGHACLDLLGLDNVEGRNVLLIRYRKMGSERLRRIAEDAEDVHLISIGYQQSVPDDISDLVETTRINDPSELTRLGIVMTRVIGDWDTESFQTVVCLDSLDILLGYKDDRSVFRFLHVLLSKLQSADAISHFHIEPSRDGDQGADTLKPLFDSIITIDDDGIHMQ
jgi:CheY-like chemotaxis protein